MKFISLTNSSVQAIVDDDAFELLSEHKWQLHRDGAIMRCALGRLIWMHRVVMNAPIGTDVDHVNRIKHDNRFSNLRPANKSLNGVNREKINRPCSSIFKGVYWNKCAGKWQAYLTNRSQTRYLGLFVDEKKAAAAYNVAASITWGEYACLNPV